MWFDKKTYDEEKVEVVIDHAPEWNEYIRIKGYSHKIRVVNIGLDLYNIHNSMDNVIETFRSNVLHTYITGYCSRPLKVHKLKNRMGCRTKSLSQQ